MTRATWSERRGMGPAARRGGPPGAGAAAPELGVGGGPGPRRLEGRAAVAGRRRTGQRPTAGTAAARTRLRAEGPGPGRRGLAGGPGPLGAGARPVPIAGGTRSRVGAGRGPPAARVSTVAPGAAPVHDG